MSLTFSNITGTRSTKNITFSGTATSDGSGDVSGTAGPFSGYLWSIEVDPVTPGVAPSALWDFVVNNGRSVDIMGGAGANMSESAAAVIYPTTADNSKPYLDGETITWVGSNMGASKQVAIRINVLQK